MEVSAVDKTGAGFASIKASAQKFSGKLGGMLGAAVSAAAAYGGVRAFSGAVQELGNLSDVAAKTGVSVEALTSTVAAFQASGLNISMDQLVKSYQYLEKSTGKIGEDAFYATLQSIAAIEDPVKRGNELMLKFGRSALELQPLVNGGEEVVQKFRTLQTLMPGVSTAAADAGDEIADAQGILGKGVQSIWLRAVGSICSMWSKNFPGGVRAGALNAVSYFEWGMKRIWNRAVKWGADIGNRLNAVWNWVANDYTWSQAMDEMYQVNNALRDEMDSQLAAIDAERNEYVEKLKSVSIDDLSGAMGKRAGTKGIAAQIGEAVGDAAGESAVKAAKRVTNNLMMGGSLDSLRLAVMGPEYENETKKQTRILERIAENTEGLGSGDALPVTDLGV
jgi:hypothetical protein